jgi:hypothetical protein
MTCSCRATIAADSQAPSREQSPGYVNGLKAGEDISRNALVALSLADPRLRSVSLEALSTRRAGLPDDTVTRLRDASGGLTTLASFDHVSIGQLEKAETSEPDVTASIAVGAAEVTTAVRFDVTLVGNPTSIGVERGVTETSLQPQVETLVRSFVESPERASQVRLADLLAFVEQGSGLFTLKPFPESFLVAGHLATGLVEREVDVVSLGEKERAELKSLTLRLLV